MGRKVKYKPSQSRNNPVFKVVGGRTHNSKRRAQEVKSNLKRASKVVDFYRLLNDWSLLDLSLEWSRLQLSKPRQEKLLKDLDGQFLGLQKSVKLSTAIKANKDKKTAVDSMEGILNCEEANVSDVTSMFEESIIRKDERNENKT